MGSISLLSFLLILQVISGALGEPSNYRQYRILKGLGYYDTLPSDTYTYYTNPYVHHPYRYRSQGSDDTVYVTDMFGRTRAQYGRSIEPSYSVSRNTYGCPSCTCTSSTCGQNAQCQVIGGRPVCSCLAGHSGDPLSYCKRAECLDNSDCRGHLTCSNERCVDPCAGACGSNSDCQTRNHVPVCTCPAGYTGDPFSSCRLFDPEELCHPSPCGSNTNCEVRNGVPTCMCLPGYHGSAIAGCRHECESDAECGPTAACIQFKCQNPCTSQCGENAECETISNHRAVCKCPKNYFGNPYDSCKPECYGDRDCPSHKPACFYGICKNTCDGACGFGANCQLRGLTPVCSCPKEKTGDPFQYCRDFEPRDLCEPKNPCGVDARCQPGFDRYNEERPVCTCPFGYTGDPLIRCFKGECTNDNECADSQACIDYKCVNPCINKCGLNAECNPRRHIAVCTCPSGYNGDALIQCHPHGVSASCQTCF